MLGVLTLAVSVLPLAIAVAGKGIVDAVVAGSREQTLRWVLIELGVVSAQALVQRALGLTRQLLGARLALDINTMILEKAMTLELVHFEDGRFYDKLTRARREASVRPASVVTEGFQLLQNTLTFSGYLALIVRYSPWVALALLVAALPATLVEMRFSRSAFRIRNRRSPESRRLNYLEYVLANDEHVKEVRLFSIGRWLLDRYRGLGEKILHEDESIEVRRSIWALLLSLVGTGTFYACYAAMAMAAALGKITLGTLTLYLVAFRQGQQAFQSILTAIGGIYEDTLYMSNLFEYLAIPVGAAPRAAGPVLAVLEEKGIRFEKVGFHYPAATGDGEPRWALRDVSFFVPEGQWVALVGPNGAGKTTLIKLLTRLYEPSEGRILLDGRDLVDWDREALRARIAVVFQDFNEYQFDLKENVGLGSLDHLDDVPRIGRATERSGADQIVTSLPEGLETKLGKWAHDGLELSGGQWQKIALARAFMREQADILVVDEPTAALDAEAEHAMLSKFRTLAAHCTTFLISHRFSTVRMADRILVLDQGRIIEDGGHDQLVAAGARYAHLFELQAQGYQ
jgi:ATP-binding cassette subfamily B protein